MTSILFLALLSLAGLSQSQGPYKPINFPSATGMGLELAKFIQWDQAYPWQVWTAYPRNGADVLAAANWALANGWNIRASGKMHNWSPITVPTDNYLDPSDVGCTDNSFFNDGSCWQMVLLKTDKLTNMSILSSQPGNFSFKAQPGITMDDLLTKLESAQMGLAHHPAPGDVTLGGVLAIGGHGAAIPALNETLPKGHTYGSLSNLILSFETVVYDPIVGAYVLKTFSRSDPEAKAFLVNLGRTFMTSVTMRAGPLQLIRCQSFTNYTAAQLFASPESSGVNKFTNFLNKYGRVETILFAFCDKPWLKVWSVLDKPKSFLGLGLTKLAKVLGLQSSRLVTSPYNYFFSDHIPPQVSDIAQQLKDTQDEFLAMALGRGMFGITEAGLLTNLAQDLWGYSKNLLLYIRPTTLLYHANGYAVICSRGNVQKVLHEGFQIYQNLITQYAAIGQYPVNGGLEVRATGVDKPEDVGMVGAESPAIAASSVVPGRPELDTVVWFDVLTYVKTVHCMEFLTDLESQFGQIFDGTFALMRVEWSKGFAYAKDSSGGANGDAWANQTVLNQIIPKTANDWTFFRDTMEKYDGGQVFTNQFLKKFDPSNTN